MSIHNEYIESAKIDGAGHLPHFSANRCAARSARHRHVCDLAVHLDMERLPKSAHLPEDGRLVYDAAGHAEIFDHQWGILFPDHGGRGICDLPAADHVHHRPEEVIEGIALGGVKG